MKLTMTLLLTSGQLDQAHMKNSHHVNTNNLCFCGHLIHSSSISTLLLVPIGRHQIMKYLALWMLNVELFVTYFCLPTVPAELVAYSGFLRASC